MRLKEGSKSIKFSMKDYTDKEVVFEKFKGQKVLLSFFRGASCPFCNLRINQLIKRYTEFEKMNINIMVLPVFEYIMFLLTQNYDYANQRFSV